MAQYKRNTFGNPFSGPVADNDPMDCYTASYYTKFPTHHPYRFRLTSSYHSQQGSFAQLEYPGVLATLDIYINDGQIMRWTSSPGILNTVFRFLRICDDPPETIHYRWQLWISGIFVSQIVSSPVSIWSPSPPAGNYIRVEALGLWYNPQEFPTDWVGQIYNWAVWKDETYPPPHPTSGWWEEFWP